MERGGAGRSPRFGLRCRFEARLRRCWTVEVGRKGRASITGKSECPSLFSSKGDLEAAAHNVSRAMERDPAGPADRCDPWLSPRGPGEFAEAEQWAGGIVHGMAPASPPDGWRNLGLVCRGPESRARTIVRVAKPSPSIRTMSRRRKASTLRKPDPRDRALTIRAVATIINPMRRSLQRSRYAGTDGRSRFGMVPVRRAVALAPRKYRPAAAFGPVMARTGRRAALRRIDGRSRRLSPPGGARRATGADHPDEASRPRRTCGRRRPTGKCGDAWRAGDSARASRMRKRSSPRGFALNPFDDRYMPRSGNADR